MAVIRKDAVKKIEEILENELAERWINEDERYGDLIECTHDELKASCADLGWEYDENILTPMAEYLSPAHWPTIGQWEKAIRDYLEKEVAGKIISISDKDFTAMMQEADKIH